MASDIIFPLKGKRVAVAGARGMVGGALVRRLAREDCEILPIASSTLDMRNQADTEAFFADRRPDAVFLAAAKVGGIHANDTYPAEFLYDNLMIAANVTAAAHRSGTQKLMFFGSSCIYPKHAPQPIHEDSLLTGALEPTNQWYAVAKIAGMKLAEAYRAQYGADFIAVQPTNLYGPGDNFHPENSHVPAALLRRFHEAREAGAELVTVWGTGTPRREFLFVDDLADASVFLMQRHSGAEPVNIGTGEDIAIADFARLVAETVGYQGALTFDTSRPDGTPRKLLDVSRLAAIGWRAKTGLREGLAKFYEAFLEAQSSRALKAS